MIGFVAVDEYMCMLFGLVRNKISWLAMGVIQMTDRSLLLHNYRANLRARTSLSRYKRLHAYNKYL